MSKLKLLTKRDIDVAKAKDRQKEIDEGAKLAKRVDNLRQLAVEEERGLEDFRVKTLSSIHGDIQARMNEKEALDAELKERREERERLMQPLDEKWQLVNDKEIELNRWNEKLEEDESSLNKAKALYSKHEQFVEDEIARLADERRVTEENFSTAHHLRDASQLIYEKAQTQSNKLALECAERELAVMEREVNSSLREETLIDKEARVQAYENRLFQHEQELKERWKVLLDTEQNHGKRK